MKHVLVYRGENLLTSGVENLLAQEEDFLVLGVKNNDDEFSSELEIDFFQPSVIILDESAINSDFPFLYEIIRKYPNMRVIVVDEGENLIQILDKRVITVTQRTDLIDIIRSDHIEGV